jgi:peptidoglycan/xylan/chitin deacetylase (PgdA/CDA1 family)
MTLRAWLGAVRRQVLCSIHTRPVSVENQGPVVTFCFDDFPRTAYTAGGSILRSFGATGTYYAALGLVNSSNELGDQLRWADIDAVLSDGHEIGCHTFSHCSCRNVSLDVFERDVLRGQDAIRKITGFETNSFAYPFGHVTVSSKKRLGVGMSSCRGIYGGIHAPVADLNLLRANSLYGDVDKFDHADWLLSENERLRGWLIFYTHDVRKNSSPFGCTPALLDKVVARTRAKGIRIATIGEVTNAALRTAAAPSAPGANLLA